MFSWFDADTADKVDKITWAYCSKTSSDSELKQLRRLFDKAYLKLVHNAMTERLATNNPSPAFLSVKLAWIDKIPLAKSCRLTNKTELGDAVFFAIEEIHNGSGSIISGARAVIVQAKVTASHNRLKKPMVPITAIRYSTKNELELLSEWPSFDLYKSSRSGTALATGLDLKGGKPKPFPFGWYLAAPRVKQYRREEHQAHWRSWWMAGAPIKGDLCNTTFGNFLEAFLKGQAVRTTTHNQLEVGARFQCVEYPPPINGTTGWDRVCAEIINIVEKNGAPPNLFVAGNRRITTFVDIPLQVQTFIADPQCRVFLRTGHIETLGFGCEYQIDPPNLFRRGKIDARTRRRGRRMPVLIFHSFLREDTI